MRRMERNVAAVAATADMIAGDRTPTPKLEPAPEAPRSEVEETVDLRLVIEVDEASGSYVYKTINRMTGEVVAQVPREEVLRMRDQSSYEAGGLIKARV